MLHRKSTNDDQLLDQEMFWENEQKTNQLASMLNVMVGFPLLALCVADIYTDYTDMQSDLIRMTAFSSGFIPLAGGLIGALFRFQRRWLKSFLLATLIIGTGISFFLFYPFSMFLFVCPAAISARYFDRRFTFLVNILVWVTYLLVCGTSVYVDIHVDSFHKFHDYLGVWIWRDPVNVIDSEIIPKTVILAIMTWVTTSIARTGRSLVRRQAESTGKINRLGNELTMAAEIQRHVLPAGMFATTPGVEIAIRASMRPAKEVAGDFYDYFMVDENRLAFLVADVSDKGAAAAMFMMAAKNALRLAVTNVPDLEKAIGMANQALSQNNQESMFVTVWIGCVDKRTGVGRFVNAGHPPPCLKHADGTVEFLKNDPDLFLGAFEDAEFKSHLLTLKDGDELLLYTDGITDALDKEGNAFGDDRLLQTVSASASGLDSLHETILTTVEAHSKGTDQFDDMTSLVLRCNLKHPFEKASLDLPAREDSVTPLVEGINAILASNTCPDDVRSSVDVCLDEVCANIADYAYEDGDEEAKRGAEGIEWGKMRVDAEAGPNFVRIEFRDCGKPFDPLTVSDPDMTDDIDELQIGGLGIHLVKNLMDRVEYRREGGMNVLTMVKSWNDPGSGAKAG